MIPAPGRNDPCPCGSGKKYKQCHLRADEARPLGLRVLSGGLAAQHEASPDVRHGVSVPPGAEVVTDVWEVDLVPLAASFDDDPAARATILVVGAGSIVLHADVLTHPPSEPMAVARLLAEGVRAACVASGAVPDLVRVRFESLSLLLRLAFMESVHPARGATVEASRELSAVDPFVAGFEQQMGGVTLGEHRASSRPETWAGWGLEREQIGRFFAACEQFCRAAPWRVVSNEDVLRVKVPRGSEWWAIVLGEVEGVPALELHADRDDVDRVMAFASDDGASTDAEMPVMRGPLLSLGFAPRDELPKRMRAEIKREEWPVAGPLFYPELLVMNTPGGGLSARQMEDLIEVLLTVPRFAEKHAAGILGETEVAWPIKYRNAATGVSVLLDEEWA